MKASFWQTLDALGASGSAASDWRLLLGENWPECAGLLRAGGCIADRMIDPDRPGRRLTVETDGDGRVVAFADEPPLRPPLSLPAGDVELLVPDWTAISEALGQSLKITPGQWENDGLNRQIGIAQLGNRPPVPVILHLPGGWFGDEARLVRELTRRNGAIVLVPTARWLTPTVMTLAASHKLSLLPLAEHFAAVAAGAEIHPILGALALVPAAAFARAKRVLHPEPGWRWDMVRMVVAPGSRLLIACDGQPIEYTLPKTTAKKPNQAHGILMKLAVEQEWRNPPSGSKDHERLRKNFHRLADLLTSLVPIPGKPFRREDGRHLPVFQISLHPDLAAGLPRRMVSR